MSIKDALKTLCQKMTSQESDSETIAGVIGDIAENYTPSEGTPGPKGDPGVGIETITGTIDGSNKLTLTFTMTDETTQTVEGTITPPAAG